MASWWRQRSQGAAIPAADSPTCIAATAHANKLDVYTRNGDDFASLEGLIGVVAI